MRLETPWLVLGAIITLQLAVAGTLAMNSSGSSLEASYVEGPTLENEEVSDTYLDLNHFFIRENGPRVRTINRSGFPYAVYQENERGLREDENFTYEKPEDTMRIGFFGDSFIWGQYANNSQLWTERLESRLNEDLQCGHDFQVINFGMNAYDGPYTVEYYLQEGQKYNLDYKFFVMKSDEIKEAMEILQPTIQETMVDYQKRHNLKKKPNPHYKREIYYEALDEALTKYRNNLSSIDRQKLYDMQVREPLRVLDKEVENDRSAVMFTTLIRDRHKELFRKQAEKHNFRYVSMDRMGEDYGYEGLWGQFSFPKQNDVHPNPSGHRFIADYLYIYMVSNNLVKCDTYQAFESGNKEDTLLE